MTTADIEAEIGPPEPDPAQTAYDATVRQARMDLSIAEKHKVLDALTVAVTRLRGRLQTADWSLRFSDLELTSPDDQFKVQVTYAGGEFVAYVTGLLGPKVRTAFRITPELYQRQPNCVPLLAEILVLMGRGSKPTLHLDPGGVPLGLECHYDSDGTLLFGERAEDLIAKRPADQIDLEDDDRPAPEADPTDPAERAQIEQDEGPPDMSGSTPGVER